MFFPEYVERRHKCLIQAALEIGINEPYLTYLERKYVIGIGLSHHDPNQFNEYDHIVKRAHQLLQETPIER